MINSLRLEFGATRQVLPNTLAESEGISSNDKPSPVPNLTESENHSSETDHVIIPNLSVQLGAVDYPTMDKEDTEKIENFFAGFIGKICTVGNVKNNTLVPSEVAALNSAPNEAASTIGKFTFSVIAQSINEAYSAFTSFIGPNADPQERIVFSAISAVSAGMRSLFPIVKEALTTLQDSHPILAVISLALVAVHVAISSIATLIATINFPTALFGTNKTSESENKPNDLKESLNLFLEEIDKKLDALREKGLVGALGAVREWLMLSSAVVSLLAILPVVIKTIAPIVNVPIGLIAGGAINLVAAIIELVQGVTEYISFGIDLKKLKADEAAMRENKSCSQDELEKLIAEIEHKENELIASKVRIGKALCGIALSVASIVSGVLMIAAFVSVPGLPSILASISVLTVAVYLVVTIAVRLDRMKKEAEANACIQPSDDSGDILVTSSDGDDESNQSDEEADTTGPVSLQVNFA